MAKTFNNPETTMNMFKKNYKVYEGRWSGVWGTTRLAMTRRFYNGWKIYILIIQVTAEIEEESKFK